MIKGGRYIVGLHSPHHTNSINIFTFIQLHSRSEYGTKMKNNPKCDKVPDRPNWAPLLIVWKRNIVSSGVLIKLPLELSRITWSGIIGPCIWFWKESVSHGDSAISHPRDQDYLSL